MIQIQISFACKDADLGSIYDSLVRSSVSSSLFVASFPKFRLRESQYLSLKESNPAASQDKIPKPSKPKKSEATHRKQTSRFLQGCSPSTVPLQKFYTKAEDATGVRSADNVGTGAPRDVRIRRASGVIGNRVAIM